MPPYTSRVVRGTATVRLATSLALAFLLGALPVAAQTFREVEPGQTPGWVFTPTFVASIAYDDNVTLAGQGAPTAADRLTVLTPATDLQYRGRHNWVGLGYDGSWSLYRTLNGLNTYDQDARFDSRHEVSRRVALLFHEQLSLHPTTDVVELVGVPFLRTGSQTNDARGEMKIQLARHTAARGSYSNEWVRFDRNSSFARFLHGGMAHAFTGTVDQELSERLTVGVGLLFRRADLSDNAGRFDMSEGSGRVSYLVAPALTVSGSLGFARLADLTALTSKTGPSWSLGAEQRFERATVSASWVRSYVPSFGLGGTLQNEEVTANLRMPVARNRVYWQAGVAWRHTDPINAGEQTLKSLWLTTWFGYAIQRWLRVEGYFWRTQQNSQLPGGIVDRNRVGIQLVTAMPMRIQ